jgi:uncharacterized protein YjeT (DUF2065 family)
MKALLTYEARLPRSAAAAAAIVIMVAFNGIFLTTNGLFMLIAPLAWYELVPGVTDTGFFNQHFIRDIGMIQMFLGVAFGLGLFAPERRVGLWAAATSWLCAHVVFHFWEVAVGICSPAVIPRDFPAVTLPALLGLALTLWALRNSPPASQYLSTTAASEPPDCASFCLRRQSL